MSDLEVIIRLIASCILGGIVGYERQSRNKAAGLRTHILVSLGSCLVMLLSQMIYYSVQGLTNADPARLAAQVISGIGFLGAGSIMANRQGFTVTGLTTAASLWVVAAVGLATGAGYWVAAGVTTLLVYLTLTALGRLERRIKACSPTACPHEFLITIQDKPGQIGKIGAYFGEAGISIRNIHIETEDEQRHRLEVAVSVEAPAHMADSQMVSGLLTVDGIVAVKVDELR
ncbi:MAG: MgtC/SapB family protein [Negativicutes bacterium]|nr:MgtC/SapB family protein [Negativicutes bacterium]